MSSEIRDIVAAARSKLPDLPSDYATLAIAQGRTAHQVRSDLLARMSTDYKAISKADMLKQVRAMGASVETGSSAASASRSNMEALLRQQGLEPVRPR